MTVKREMTCTCQNGPAWALKDVPVADQCARSKEAVRILQGEAAQGTRLGVFSCEHKTQADSRGGMWVAGNQHGVSGVASGGVWHFGG